MLSRDEADFVLRHELMHIRRGDVLLNTMLFGLLSLHWFNPLLWFAFFRAEQIAKRHATKTSCIPNRPLDGLPTERRSCGWKP